MKSNPKWQKWWQTLAAHSSLRAEGLDGPSTIERVRSNRRVFASLAEENKNAKSDVKHPGYSRALLSLTPKNLPINEKVHTALKSGFSVIPVDAADNVRDTVKYIYQYFLAFFNKTPKTK